MRIRSLLSGAVITLLLLALVVLSTPTSSQEVDSQNPFEISRQICLENNWTDSWCLTNTGGEGVLTVGDIINMLNSDIESMRAKNNWSPEVTEDTIWPIGAMLVRG